MLCFIRPFVYLFDKTKVIREKRRTLLKAIKEWQNVVKRGKLSPEKEKFNVCIDFKSL